MKNNLSKTISEARVASLRNEVKIKNSGILSETDFSEINLNDGEIQSVITKDGKKLIRGMAVKVSSHYTGEGVAVIIGFTFKGSLLPVMISRGGAEGELIACVRVCEISLFPTQKEMNYQGAICLSVTPDSNAQCLAKANLN